MKDGVRDSTHEGRCERLNIRWQQTPMKAAPMKAGLRDFQADNKKTPMKDGVRDLTSDDNRHP